MLRLEKGHWGLLAGAAGGRDQDNAADRRGLIDDLRHCGLWRETFATGDLADRAGLFRLARDKGLTVDVLPVSGAYLAMTNIDEAGARGPIRTTASGSGFSIDRAVLGCLGEAVEFCSWVFRRSDRERLLGDADLAGAERIDASRVLGFSPAQLASRERLNRVWDGWDRIPPAGQLACPQFWSAVATFDGTRSAACPAFLCHGRFGELVHGDPTLDADSNGCAAGPTIELARTRALLELAERDAAGIWWNRGCVRPRLDIADLDATLRATLMLHCEETARRVWFLDISTFASAAVVAAVSCRADGAGLALGFGAAFDRRDAARSAFLELVQSETAIEACAVRAADGHRARPPEDRGIARWTRFADLRNLPFVAGSVEQRTDGDKQAASAEVLLDEIEHACGTTVWFADLTRAEFAVPVVKALCEGLAHYKLRRGSPRYADVPRLNGWHTTRDGTGRSDPRRLLV